jgi:hypothetical protein
MSAIDIRQQRCGQLLLWFGDTRLLEQAYVDGEPTRIEQCAAWRLSRPRSGGAAWRPCWDCNTDQSPQGPTFTDHLSPPTTLAGSRGASAQP